MEEGLIDAVIMAAYIPQGPRDEAALQQATAFAINRLNEIHRQGKINNERMGIARTPQEIQSLKNIGKKAILLGVENGYAIGKDLDNIKRFKDLDVVYITLCHNGDNDICDSARGHAEWNGLSPFGKEVIKKMNEEGLMVDLSHAAESTFYDALENSQYPIIAYKGFINEDSEKASLSDAIRHIEHIVDLIGIDYVGIGSDFDGDGELIGCRSTNELINITTRLLKDGFNENEIAKIWGGNLLRVMSIVQEASSYK